MIHMKVWRKFTAVALAFVMVLAMSATAFATREANDFISSPAGEVGGYTESTKDTQKNLDKAINIQKEITAFNPDGYYVYGPEITYTYAIAPASNVSGASEMGDVTDATTDHTNGVAVTVTTVPGVGSDTGTENADTITLTGNDPNNLKTIKWTNEDILETSAAGVANIKTIKVDFNNIVFENPGVYRYKITETATYANTGVTASDSSTTHYRFLDVYVKRSDTFVEKSADKTAYEASDWQIYGYVCVPSNDDIDPDSTTKTNGFVNSASSGSASNADVYKTYNLTIKKVLDKETTAMNTYKYPFKVTFKNASATGNFQLIANATGTADVSTVNASATTDVNGATITSGTVLTKVATNGAALAAYDSGSGLKIGHNGTVEYRGIPEGTTFTVTETNDVVGTTYTTSIRRGENTTAETALSGASAATFVAYDATNHPQGSTGSLATGNSSVSINTGNTAGYEGTAPATGKDVYVEFTNSLALISPTGVTLRYAPYLAMLGAGVVALPLTFRRKKEELF